MENLTYTGGYLTFRGQEFSCHNSYIEGDAAIINLKNDCNDFDVIFVANEVTINGVLQTSAQMIIDTLSNG